MSFLSAHYPRLGVSTRDLWELFGSIKASLQYSVILECRAGRWDVRKELGKSPVMDELIAWKIDFTNSMNRNVREILSRKSLAPAFISIEKISDIFTHSDAGRPRHDEVQINALKIQNTESESFHKKFTAWYLFFECFLFNLQRWVETELLTVGVGGIFGT